MRKGKVNREKDGEKVITQSNGNDERRINKAKYNTPVAKAYFVLKFRYNKFT